MVGTKCKPKAAAPSEYKPNDREREALDRVGARVRKAKTGDRLRVDKLKIEPAHKDVLTGTVLQMDALGLSSYDGYALYLKQLMNAVTKGRDPDEGDLNGALGFVKAMQPRDDLEAHLLAQMAATHDLAMTFARRLNHVENTKQQDSASNAYTKLLRAFAAQMQTLKQYRTGGQQTVIVQRVDVREGGQAIVGNVAASQTEGRGDGKNGGQPHALADSRGSQMLCEVQEDGRKMQRPSYPGQEHMPDARRQEPRRAEGEG
jgi:hypothetical protein